MRDTQGPKGKNPIDPDGMRFRAVRVSARLRREATLLPRQVDAAGRGPIRRGPAQIGSQTVQVTPGLVRALREMFLLMELDRMIRERLGDEPALAELKALLDGLE